MSHDPTTEVYRRLEAGLHNLGELGVTGVVLAAETSEGVLCIIEDGSPSACVQLARAAFIKLQTSYDQAQCLGVRFDHDECEEGDDAYD